MTFRNADPGSTSPTAPWRRWLPRAWWGLLALIHVGPLVTCTHSVMIGGHASLAGCLVLWLAFAFFICKLIDIPALRWRLKPSTFLALILACALAHDDIVPNAAGKAIFSELPQLAATCLIVDGLRRSLRHLPRLLAGLTSRLRAAAARLPAFRLACLHDAISRFRGPDAILANALMPRGPPA